MSNNYDYNKVNKAVANFADELEIKHASNGDLDLYVLMRNYLNDPVVRKKVNSVLKENSCI